MSSIILLTVISILAIVMLIIAALFNKIAYFNIQHQKVVANMFAVSYGMLVSMWLTFGLLTLTAAIFGYIPAILLALCQIVAIVVTMVTTGIAYRHFLYFLMRISSGVTFRKTQFA